MKFSFLLNLGMINFGFTKGQLISKSPFGVFNSPKKNNKIFSRISALTSKLCIPSTLNIPYTVAQKIECVCGKMLNRGLNHGLFLSLFKLIPCHIMRFVRAPANRINLITATYIEL